MKTKQSTHARARTERKKTGRRINVVTVYVSLIFLVVAVLLGTLFYMLRSSTLEREARETLVSLTASLADQFDSQIVDVMERQVPLRIAARDVATEYVQTLAQTEKPRYEEIHGLIQLLGEIKSAYSVPDEMEIYFPVSRTLVGTRGVRFLSDKKYTPNRLNAYWESLGVRDSMWMKRTEDAENTFISFLRIYPGIFQPENEPVLILSCRETGFLERLRALTHSLLAEDRILLMTYDNRIASAEEASLSGLSLTDLMEGDEVRLPEGHYLLASHGTAARELMLGLMRRKSDGTDISFLWWALPALAFLLIALILVLYVHSRHYTLPMNRLAEQMHLTDEDGPLYSPGRTFSRMETQIGEMQEMHEEKAQAIEKSRQSLRESYLKAMIRDEMQYMHPLPELGLAFPYTHLQCIMLSDSPDSREEQALSDMFSGFPCQVEVFQSDQREWLYLVNFDLTDGMSLTQLLCNAVEHMPDSELAFGVGLPVQTGAMLGVSYRCARRALSGRYFEKQQRVWEFRKDQVHATDDQAISEVLGKVVELPYLAMNRSRENEESPGEEKISEIIRSLRQMIPYMGTTRSIMLLTGACFAKAAYDMKVSPAEVYGGDLMQVYYHLEDIDSYAARMRLDCQRLSAYMRRERASGNQSLVTMVQEVMDNCPPSELSTQTIAETLGISTGHLSRVFHQETGEKLVDRIQKTRMEHAARLLRETDMSLEEICSEVGYSRVQYLTGKFREYSGMTLTEYRQAMRGK